MCAEDNFATLINLRPVLDQYGHPIMSSGNFSVVFKMEDIETKELFAIKCFIKDQTNRESAYRKITKELSHIKSSYLIRLEYLESELFVYTLGNTNKEYPVVKMDWIEGMTLSNYLVSIKDNNYARKVLFFSFCNLSKWLLNQTFAHGDIKPDNILVDDSGCLALIDYDGMYVPSMEGENSRELGSEDYRHPQRTHEKFNNEIDDFAILTISLSLLLQIECYDKVCCYLNDDQMILRAQDYFDNNKLAKIGEIAMSTNNRHLSTLYSMLLLSIEGELLHSQFLKSFKTYYPLELIPFSLGNKEVFYELKYGKLLDEIVFDWITPVDSTFQQSSAFIATQCFRNGYEPGTLRTAYKYKEALITCSEDLKSPIWYESIRQIDVSKEKKYFIVELEEKMGVIDCNNNIIIDIKYQYVKCSKHGNELFYDCSLSNYKQAELLDEHGKRVLNQLFHHINDYTSSDGKLFYMLCDISSKGRLYDVENNQLSEVYDNISRQFRIKDSFIIKKNNIKTLVNIVTGVKISIPFDSECVLDIDNDVVLIQKADKKIGLWNTGTQSYVTNRDYNLYELSFYHDCKIQKGFVLCTNSYGQLVMLQTTGKEFIIQINNYHSAFQTDERVVVLFKLPVVKRGLCPYKVYLFSLDKIETCFEINQYSSCNPYGKFSSISQNHIEIFQQHYFTGNGDCFDLKGNKINLELSTSRNFSVKNYRETLKKEELHQIEIDISKKYFSNTYIKNFHKSQNSYNDDYDAFDYVYVVPGRILSSVCYYYDFGDDEGHTDSGRIGFVDFDMCYWKHDNN